MKAIVDFLFEALDSRGYKKKDWIEGKTDSGMLVAGPFVEFTNYKGKEYVRVSGGKNTYYTIPVDLAKNVDLEKRELAKVQKAGKKAADRALQLEDEIKKIGVEIMHYSTVNDRNDLEAWFAENPDKAETGELPEEYKKIIKDLEAKEKRLRKELLALKPDSDLFKIQVFKTYDEYMKGNDPHPITKIL